MRLTVTRTLLGVLCSCSALVAVAQDCGSDRIDSRAQVQRIIDGDTLALTDGTRIRLLGIDTPETGSDGVPPEPLALQAEDQLRSLVDSSDGRVGLRYGIQPRDDYGRTLAHVFDEEGRNLSAELLRDGLAVLLLLPPNLALQDCYASAERAARERTAGLWSLPSHRPRDVRELTGDDGVYRQVRGRVVTMDFRRRSVWLIMDGGFELQIHRNDLRYFGSEDPRQLIGRTVLARGIVYDRGMRRRIRIRHPAQVEAIDRPPDTEAGGG